ncbi:hypothetical protein jhhlp_007229 [Lomentospora prolificans]|uniref:DNL-type domain-containing protein n=1 Tax=Lomentospora prolificans TaxID=41688 RepID=A0A2N3N230_9PEZI|nr:hypothetical protein jhhlp_007229 [Lomentospora prolificans]
MASRFSPFLRLVRTTPTVPLRRNYPPSSIASQRFYQPIRCAHSIPRPPPASPTSNDSPDSPANTPETSSSPSDTNPTNSTPRSYPIPKPVPNYYQLHFTCVPCGTPSVHNISKQGYHHGSVLVSCPECRNRHVISDHLNIFGDRKVTVEDLVRENGGIVRKGTLGVDGDIEFWADETDAEGNSGNQSA